MPRFGLDLSKATVFADKYAIISTSQEEAFENCVGWDDAHQEADDTPSQLLERSSISPPEDLETMQGNVSSTMNAVRSSAMVQEDSYNEAYESDRSQSPSKTVSWSLGGGGVGGGVARDGCSNDPKSPASVTATADKSEKSPLTLKVTGQVKLTTRLGHPAESSVASASRVEFQVHQESRAEQDADISSGRREASARADFCVEKTTGACEGRPPVRCTGVRLAALSSGRDVPAVGSGSGSALMSLRRKNQDSQPAFVVESQMRFEVGESREGQDAAEGCERRDAVGEAGCGDGARDIPHAVRSTGAHVVGLSAGKDVQPFGSGSDSAFMSLRREKQDSQPALQVENHVQFEVGEPREEHDADGRSGRSEAFYKVHCGDGVHETTAAIPSVSSTRVRVVGSSSGRDGQAFGVGSGSACPSYKRKEQDSQPGFPVEKDSKVGAEGGNCVHDLDRMVDAVQANVKVIDEMVVEDCSPPSPLRPSQAVQDKLEKIRSKCGNKRTHTGGFDLLADRLRKERGSVSSSTALEAIKLRSGERLEGEVTAADLLRTALNLGIPLFPPFHKNYFRE